MATTIEELDKINKSITEKMELEDFYEQLGFFLKEKNETQIMDLVTTMIDRSLSPEARKECFEKINLICKEDNSLSKKVYWILGGCYGCGFGTQKDVNNAAFYYKLASKNNCKYGLCALANCYFGGEGVTEDKDMAIKLFKLSAREGHPEAQSVLGQIYLDGLFDVPKNFTEAMTLFELAEKQGHARTKYELAQLHEKGEQVTQNYSKALSLYQEAAQLSNAKALIKLADIYAAESSPEYKIEQDLKKSVEYYTKAVEQEDGDAYVELGNCYECGIGVEQDLKKAAELYKRGSALEHIGCLYALASCYSIGEGVVKDKLKAIKYYELILKQGNDDYAHYKIGSILFSPEFYHRYNVRAVKHLKCASLSPTQDEYAASAQSMLADCYTKQNGIGVTKNYRRAILLVMNALKIRNDEADQKKLTEYLLSFPDHPKTLEESFSFYRKHVNEDSWYMDLLGFCYHYGLGTEKNPDEAIACYKECVKKNRPYVLWDLLDIYNSLDSSELDAQEVLNYFKNLAKNSNPSKDTINAVEFHASRVLMCIYQDGMLGQEKSILKSSQYVVEKLFRISPEMDFHDIRRNFEYVYSNFPSSPGSKLYAEELPRLESAMILNGFKKYIKGIYDFNGIDALLALIAEYTLDLPTDNEICWGKIEYGTKGSIIYSDFRPEFRKPFD